MHEKDSTIALVAAALVAGCATSGSSVGPWTGLQAARSDQAFYLGRYIGTQTDCFPPINKRLCIPLKKDEYCTRQNSDSTWSLLPSPCPPTSSVRQR